MEYNKKMVKLGLDNLCKFSKHKKARTMTIEQLKTLVIEELDSRELESIARYSALDKVIPFIKKQYGVDASSLPASKDELKDAYEKYKGKILNSAESSVINELYNQLAHVCTH